MIDTLARWVVLVGFYFLLMILIGALGIIVFELIGFIINHAVNVMGLESHRVITAVVALLLAAGLAAVHIYEEW